MSRVSKLYALQQIDTSRDRDLARLAEVVAALKSNEAVQAASSELAAAEADLAELERRMRAESAERDGVREHLKREEQKLFGGAVKAPKELQNLQRETEALRRQLGTHDDLLLELMVARDDAEERVSAAGAALAEVSGAAELEAQELLRERARLAVELRELDGQRHAAHDRLPAGDLAAYEGLRKAKGGVAIGPLRGDACGVCGMQLPRHEADRVRDGEDLVACPGCGRILWA